MNQIIAEHLKNEHQQFILLHDFILAYVEENEINISAGKYTFISIKNESFSHEVIYQKSKLDYILELVIEPDYITLNKECFISYEWISNILCKYSTSNKFVKWNNDTSLAYVRLKKNKMTHTTIIIFDLEKIDFTDFDLNEYYSDDPNQKELLIDKADLLYSDPNGRKILFITDNKPNDSTKIIREIEKLRKDPIHYKPDF